MPQLQIKYFLVSVVDWSGVDHCPGVTSWSSLCPTQLPNDTHHQVCSHLYPCVIFKDTDEASEVDFIKSGLQEFSF